MKDWIKKMKQNPPLVIIEGGTRSRPKDTSLDKYYEENRRKKREG